MFPDENLWFPCTSEYFYKNKKNSKDGLYPECKRCSSKRSYERENRDKEGAKEYKHQYYIDNKEKRLSSFKERYNTKKDEWKVYQKEYIKKNPEKFKKYSVYRSQHKKHQIRKIEWEECKKYFDYTCAYCGLPLSEHYYTRNGITKLGDFHKEHANHKGSNDLSNCVPSCQVCNSEKHDKSLEEWYINSPKYSKERYSKIIQWLTEDYKLYIQPPKPKGKYTKKIN